MSAQKPINGIDPIMFGNCIAAAKTTTAAAKLSKNASYAKKLKCCATPNINIIPSTARPTAGAWSLPRYRKLKATPTNMKSRYGALRSAKYSRVAVADGVRTTPSVQAITSNTQGTQNT